MAGLLDIFNDPVRMGLLSSGIATISGARRGDPNAALIGPQMMNQISQQQMQNQRYAKQDAQDDTQFGWAQQDRETAQARRQQAIELFKGTPLEQLASADPETALSLYQGVIKKQMEPSPLAAKQAELAAAGIDPNSPQGQQYQGIYVKPENSGLVNAGDGNIYNPQTQQWITAPGGGKKEPPSGYMWAEDGVSLQFRPGGPADPAAAKRNTPTEDERKGAGWLAQATNAYDNMLKAVSEDPKASDPGFWETVLPASTAGYAQSAPRQKFTQAASSFAEAALRAATGAGVNKDEAAQKVKELTPQYFDTPELKKQKFDSMKIYLESLQERAGRAVPEGYSIPEAKAPGSSGEWKIRPVQPTRR